MSGEEMEIAITLVQNGDMILPDDILLGETKHCLGDRAMRVGKLGPGALDIVILDHSGQQDSLQSILLERLPHHVDVCVQPVVGREKKLLLCDMDSTIIGQECIDELAEYAGLKDRISAITERAMRGELDFEAALTERVSLLKGLALTSLQACFDDRIRLTPGARTLVQTMKARGARAELVSGGFTFFTSRVAEKTGFDADFANVLLDDGTALTGEVQHPILGKQAKLDRLQAALGELGLDLNHAVAIGDGANDSAIIEAAGLGLGFNPHPVLADAANAVISGPSLTTALYFQGIPKSDWIEA